MSLSPLVIGLTLLFCLVSVALYSALKLIATALGYRKAKIFIITLGLSAAYIALLVSSHNTSEHLYRWSLNFLGLATFAGFLSVGFWLVIFVCRLASSQHNLLRPASAISYLLILTSLTTLAVFNFHKPLAIKEITLVSDKISRPYRFIQISDIQFGTSTKAEMDAVLQTAYKQNPEFIVFTGDLIDSERYLPEDFASLAASPVPIYFERGNHEFYHDPTRLLNYLKTIGPIELLINKKVYFDELEIIGIDFGNTENYLASQLQTFTLNTKKYSILLYHEPKDVEAAVDKGFDLLLFGHTHAGQIWPYTWVVDWLYTYSDGLYTSGNSTIYTSDGASLWGPRMRLGSQNEIVIFNLQPK